MNQSVSVFSLGAAPMAAPKAETHSAIPERGHAARERDSFSSVLDRAVKQPTPRGRSAAKSASATPPRKNDSTASDTLSEHRSPVREKAEAQDKPEDDCLAGACAVTGQAPVLDDKPLTNEPMGAGNSVKVVALNNLQEGEANQTGEAVTQQLIDLTSGKVPGIEGEAAKTTNAGNDLLEAVAPLESSRTNETAATPELKQSASQISDNSTPAPTTAELPTEVSMTADQSVLVEGDDPAPDFSKPPIRPETTPVQAQQTIEAQTELESAFPGDALSEVQSEAVAAPAVVREVVRSAREVQAKARESSSGISGAQLQGTMNTGPKKEEIAGNTQQILPGNHGINAASPAKASTPSDVPRLERKSLDSIDATAGVLRNAPAPVRADFGSELISEVRPASTMVRVGELITREVKMFHRGADDLVEVVLTPDVKTQLSLRLQWRDGQVEVQARCDFGDYRSLNTQWPQLQSALATQGVRLSHLSERVPTGLTDFFNNPAFSQNQRGNQQSAGSADANEPMPILPSTASQPANKPIRLNGNQLFDFWA